MKNCDGSKKQLMAKPDVGFDARKLVTTRQFADSLTMSYEWARKLVQRRQVSVVKIGRSVRIPETEIARLIQANLVPAQRG